MRTIGQRLSAFGAAPQEQKPVNFYGNIPEFVSKKSNENFKLNYAGSFYAKDPSKIYRANQIVKNTKFPRVLLRMFL